MRPSACALAALVAIAACAAPLQPLLPLEAKQLPPPVATRSVDHVVIVVVDGLRPDAIAAARAPNLQRLMRDGAATAAARVVEQPETLPSFMTMATSRPPSAHGVHWNNDRGGTFADETVFTRAHAAGLRTGLYFGKSKLALVAPRGSADVVWGPGPGKTYRERGPTTVVAERFAADFPRERFALALVHLTDTDAAGHAHGWMSAGYLAAVEVADRGLGAILGAIEGNGRAGATAVLLTADHGGEGTSHGEGRGETSWLIPFACLVPGVAPDRIAGTVTHLDLAPTALALLGLPSLPGAQGRAIPECLPQK